MEKREGNLIINKALGSLIAVVLASLFALVGYIYVQDRVRQKEQDHKIERRLEVIDMQLEVMTDCLTMIDPDIRDKVWQRLYYQHPPTYRGFSSDSQ